MSPWGDLQVILTQTTPVVNISPNVARIPSFTGRENSAPHEQNGYGLRTSLYLCKSANCMKLSFLKVTAISLCATQVDNVRYNTDKHWTQLSSPKCGTQYNSCTRWLQAVWIPLVSLKRLRMQYDYE